MKIFFYLSILLAFLISCSTIREDKISKLRKAPPGTVRINDSLFMDVTEIGNLHWREFVYALLMRDTDTLASIKNTPDTTVWKNDSVIASDYKYDYYFRHPVFNYYPVVGITYEQAVTFCEWRSKMVNYLYQLDPSMNPIKGKKYHYRLPTIEEWESAAENLDSIKIPTKFKKKGNIDLKHLANVYKVDSIPRLNDVKSYTTGINSYLPNKFGIYNMIGNVSEMTATKGVAKGGDFLLPLDSCKINMHQTYTKPEVWLGFRCVCEIVKE